MRAFILFALCCISLTCITLVSNCTTDMPSAGGTTDTGNPKIAAVIFSQDGKQRAAHVKLTIIPAGYLPDTGDDSTKISNQNIKELFTNDSGFFSIDSLDTGEYFIEVNDANSSAVLLKASISMLNQPTILLVDTLRPYATIIGNAGNSSDTSKRRTIQIYGLDRQIPVSNDGTFIIKDLPAGIFHLMMTFINNTSKPIDIGDVQTISSKTVKIPFAGWSNRSDITINTTASGADVPVDVYKFPLLIRLSESTFDFSLAKGDGADCRFSKLSNIPLTHSVEMWDSLQKKASIWVLMDTIHGNSVQSISMLYGNSGAGTPAKSPDVFDTADGFLGNYHFNGNLKDATVNKYNGVDSGTIDSPDGIIGKSRGFDGLKSFFQLKNLPDRPTGTISFWYRLAHKIDTSLAVTQGIWGKAVNDSINFTMSFIGKDYYIGPGLNSTGSLTTKTENADTGFYLISKTNTFVKNNWYHVAWCWGKNKNLLYINGILENSNPDSRSVSGGGNDEIGRSPYDVSNIQYGIPRYFNGSLDEFRIEKTVRNEYWIKLSFMNQSENDKLVSIKK